MVGIFFFIYIYIQGQLVRNSNQWQNSSLVAHWRLFTLDQIFFIEVLNSDDCHLGLCERG